MITPVELGRMSVSIVGVFILLSILWFRGSMLRLKTDVEQLKISVADLGANRSASDRQVHLLFDKVALHASREVAGGSDRSGAAEVRRVAAALDALQSRLERLEGVKAASATSSNTALALLRREVEASIVKANSDVSKRIDSVHDSDKAQLQLLQEQIGVLREQVARLKSGAPERHNNVTHAGDVTARNSSWLPPLERKRLAGALTSRVYDTSTSTDRLELLDDIHRLIDRVMTECPTCARDGASNHALQRRIYLNVSSIVKPAVICETGFGAGHGAAAFLLGGRTRSEYIGFDLLAREYSRRAVALMQEVFASSQITVLEGSSGVNTAKHFERLDVEAHKTGVPRTLCELSHVDGGRFAGVPLKDLRELHKHSAENSVVIMDDAVCKADNQHICSEPGKAWHRMKLEAKVFEEKCYAKESEGVEFCVGRFRNTKS